MATAPNDLVPYRTAEVVVHQQSAADFMPVMDIQQAVARRDALVQFTSKIMNEGLDFGTIPGSAKPCLLKAGAEKLCTFFGLVGKFEAVEFIEDWTGAQHGGEPLFYYRYRCTLTRNGQVIGEGEGSCSSWESKYRYRWVDESYVAMNDMDRTKLLKRGGRASEFEFAIDKAETTGKYGKPAEYWQRYKDAIAAGTATKIQKRMKEKTSPAWEIDSTQYRVPNPDICDVVNTCQKMGQKRALIAATLIGVNASEYFTQDLEDKIERDEPGPDDFNNHGNEMPPFNDEPPPSQRQTQAAARPAAQAQPRQTTAAAPPAWDCKAAVPGFAELRDALGEIRYNELFYKRTKGRKEVSELASREEAQEVYQYIASFLTKDAYDRIVKRSSPPAATTPAEEKVTPAQAEADPELTKQWARMKDIKSVIAAFQSIHETLVMLVPNEEEAHVIYREQLAKFGVEHSNKFKNMAQARQCFGGLWTIARQLEAEQMFSREGEAPSTGRVQ